MAKMTHTDEFNIDLIDSVILMMAKAHPGIDSCEIDVDTTNPQEVESLLLFNFPQSYKQYTPTTDGAYTFEFSA